MPISSKNYHENQHNCLVKQLGSMLKYYREQSGLSQNKLSKVSKVSISTINEIENLIVSDVRLSTISTLAATLNIDPLKLLAPANFIVNENDKKDFKSALKIFDRINRRIT